ncbi:MAG: acetyl-CoA C-acetyltransferase [Acidimicrobiia bacterium]|nr:acetyl-CoA C-acetyltransferase [Acidimicrobiia bacterium]
MTVIVGAARTPIGKFGGALSTVRAVELGGHAIGAAVERSGIDPNSVDEVLMGHVLQAGEGQITALQAATRAGLPMTVPSTTINKVCLSGLAAIGLADRAIRLGDATTVVAGGMESMSSAPYVVPSARWGARLGDAQMVDVLQHDGLYCAFDHCTMGESSDHKNVELGINREEQDAWGARSHARAAAATDSGAFAEEIAPLSIPQRRGEPIEVATDEGIRAGVTEESLGGLRPAFTTSGTITAGNASQISDGAAAVVAMDEDTASSQGRAPLARFLAWGQAGGPDATLHERPVESLTVALAKTDLDVGDLHAVEINEAFAAVALHATHALGLSEDIVNVHGGAVALGHPIGATGARLVVSLITILRRRGGGIGAVTLCGGGGQGDALIIEVPA